MGARRPSLPPLLSSRLPPRHRRHLRRTPPDLKQQLAAYLADLDAEQKRYLATQAKAEAALDSVKSESPDDSWSRAADDLRDARDEYNELAVRAQGIEPPPALADAHQSLAKSLQLFGQFTDTTQSDLRDQDVQAVVAWPRTLAPLADRVTELRGEWRTETTAYARELGVEVPGWVKTVGTRD